MNESFFEVMVADKDINWTFTSQIKSLHVSTIAKSLLGY